MYTAGNRYYFIRIRISVWIGEGKKVYIRMAIYIVLRTCTCCLHKLLGRVTAEPLLVGLENDARALTSSIQSPVAVAVAGEARVVLASHEGRYRRRRAAILRRPCFSSTTGHHWHRHLRPARVRCVNINMFLR
jgi:hypothetical protein